jgi:hypothetical protein
MLKRLGTLLVGTLVVVSGYLAIGAVTQAATGVKSGLSLNIGVGDAGLVKVVVTFTKSGKTLGTCTGTATKTSVSLSAGPNVVVLCKPTASVLKAVKAAGSAARMKVVTTIKVGSKTYAGVTVTTLVPAGFGR